MSEKYYSEITAPMPMAAMLDGRLFRWFYNAPLADSATKEFLFLMPPEKSLIFHGRDFTSGRASTKLEVFVNPTFSSIGTPFNNYFNLNAQSPLGPDAQVWQNPTITSPGALSDVDVAYGSTASGNRGSSGSGTTREFPRIMPKGMYILARLTHTGDANDAADITYKLFWEEI